jgi:SAM-dependent methyltransferase
MAFFASSDSYERFMGRFSRPLAALVVEFARVEPGQRIVDVGCGTGALTDDLVARLGADNVAALDPSEPMAAALRERHPSLDVRIAPAEAIPFGDDDFDAAIAQLVVHFMTDPVAGLREMARVTRSGGVVAATVWDTHGGTSPLSLFWDTIAETDPSAPGETHLAGARQGHLGELFREAGLADVEEDALTVDAVSPSFDDWWEPYTLGIGPAGAYVSQLDPEARERLRSTLAAKLPAAGPVTIAGRAWAARGRVT